MKLALSMVVAALFAPLASAQVGVRVPNGGVVLSRTLAGALGVSTGDTVTLDVLEGHRPTRQVQVTGLVEHLLGAPNPQGSNTLAESVQKFPDGRTLLSGNARMQITGTVEVRAEEITVSRMVER